VTIPLSKYRDLLSQYLRPHKGMMGVLALLLFGNIGLTLVNPQIIRHFIDTAKSGGDMDVLMWAAVVYIVVALGMQILAVSARYVSEKLAWRATNTLREDLATHCLNMDMAFHNEKSPGEFIERIDGDVANLANFFSQFTIRIVANIFLLFGVLGVLYWEDWRVGVAFTVYAIVTMVALVLLRNFAVPYWKEARESNAKLFGFLEEHLQGTEDVRANGGVAYAMNLLYKLAGVRLEKERKAGIMNIAMWMTVSALNLLGHVMAMIAGYYMYQAGLFTIGTVFMVLWYTQTLFRPLEQLTRQMEDLQKASAAIERIEELAHIQSKILNGSGVVFPKGALGVDFEQVTFGYHAGEMVLHDVSFALEPGKVMGLLGRTGSGKTTMTRLLFRLYDTQKGVIRLGGQDIRQAEVHDLRKHIGMVTQNVQLFRATVRENVTFFDASVSDAHIMQVIEEVGLEDWFSRLSNGLDTRLEGTGGGLSAGEAQLLTFTRVFLKDPGLVILDEASSRLDPATEEQIEKGVEKLLENRTGIIIAHRLATVSRADDILILEDGHIQEYGKRADLVADDTSRFATLLKTGLTEVLA